ncbi:MAG: hypothetical protein QM500_08090 [Methylococcales bacterium]
MRRSFFEFCALCYKSTSSGLSPYYCENHQPRSKLYNKDRGRLKTLQGDKFKQIQGYEKKIRELSYQLDMCSASSSKLLSVVKRVNINGKLSFKSAFDVIENNYKHASVYLEREQFSYTYRNRWVSGFLSRLGLNFSEYEYSVKEMNDSELFDSIVVISARYDAYQNLSEKFPDGRHRSKNLIISDSEKAKYISAINSIPLKPNGKVCRTSFGRLVGVDRYKGRRIINKLKTNGDIDGDI